MIELLSFAGKLLIGKQTLTRRVCLLIGFLSHTGSCRLLTTTNEQADDGVALYLLFSLVVMLVELVVEAQTPRVRVGPAQGLPH
jgi:hypothetical protein